MSSSGKASKGKKAGPVKIFISYAHKDEKFKDELLIMLAELENQRVLKVWQDRQIEEGSDWYKKIQEAMRTCKMAILLVSPDFLASRFIRDEELPKLLKDRVKRGLKVIPIIVRDCMWEENPSISKIQALPRDGTPVISYPKANGKRDRIWKEIGQSIKRRAKSM